MQSSLMTFHLCRPGGVAWSEMISITQKYNDLADGSEWSGTRARDRLRTGDPTMTELQPWITPAILIGGFAFLYRQIAELRGQVSDLRDRMGRIEGSLDVLQAFLIRHRDTAA